MRDKTKKIMEWIYRIFCFTILHSLIITIGFVSLYTSMNVIIERGLMTWKIQVGLIQVALAVVYLQIANILYWIYDINIFNFKMEKKKQ